jgi:hypothetical protein
MGCAMTGTAAIYDTSTTPPLVPPVTSGAVSGGLLRPGAIDQGAFADMLRAQQSAREAAGVGGRPVNMPVPSFQTNIPTLTSAQFAALVGGNSDVRLGDPAEGPAGDPQSALAAARPASIPSPAATPPLAAPIKLSGVVVYPPNGPATGTPLETAATDAADAADMPTIFRPSDLKQTASADPGPAPSPGMPPDPAASSTPTAPAAPPASAIDAKAGTPDPANPNLIHLKSAPTREEQRDLMAQHKRWMVDETPGSRELFFGPSGQFGWKDVLDIINPLQHIPIVSQIYQAITGDKMNGAAELLGAIPFGPLGGVGMIAAVADLAIRDVTGKDIGGNLEAMVFGNGSGSGAPSAANAASTGASAARSAQSAAANLELARQQHNNARA